MGDSWRAPGPRESRCRLKYVLFFAIVWSAQFLALTALLVFVCRYKRRERRGLPLRVLLLMIVVSVLSVLPFGVLVGEVVYLVALKRLSGMDVLSTVMLAFCIAIPLFALAIYVGWALDLDLNPLVSPR
jgi:ABC-type xylose transport system permease subunit